MAHALALKGQHQQDQHRTGMSSGKRPRIAQASSTAQSTSLHLLWAGWEQSASPGPPAPRSGQHRHHKPLSNLISRNRGGESTPRAPLW